MEMFPPKKESHKGSTISPLPLDLSDLHGDSPLKCILTARTQSEDLRTTGNVSSICEVDELNLEKEDCEECVKMFFICSEELNIYRHEIVNLPQHLYDFYLNNIVITAEKILDICIQTIDQSKCREWYSARRLRLSASSNIHQIKIRRKKTIEILVGELINPKTVGCAATRYGLSQEELAKNFYETLYGCEVKKIGLVISKYQPWLCASVDGVVTKDKCILKLVEFKCPLSCKNKPIIDTEKQTCNVSYLKFNDGILQLRTSHIYFTQVQVQLYVSGLAICDLFIYSPKSNGSCVVKVHRDEKFLQSAILVSEAFYFQHYLPAIYTKVTEVNRCGNNSELNKRIFSGKDIRNRLNNESVRRL